MRGTKKIRGPFKIATTLGLPKIVGEKDATDRCRRVLRQSQTPCLSELKELVKEHRKTAWYTTHWLPSSPDEPRYTAMEDEMEGEV